jgi:hypothetical protein
MSVLGKIGMQAQLPEVKLSEVKLAEVKLAEVKLEEEPRFIIISSRIVNDLERNVLNDHGKGIADFDSKYSTLSLEECFKQLKCSFLIFQLCDHEDKLYIMTHMPELTNFNIVALKSAHESYDELWLTELKENAKAVVMKSLENNSLIKDADFFNFLKTFVHIDSPPACIALVWRTVSNFLGL